MIVTAISSGYLSDNSQVDQLVERTKLHYSNCLKGLEPGAGIRYFCVSLCYYPGNPDMAARQCEADTGILLMAGRGDAAIRSLTVGVAIDNAQLAMDKNESMAFVNSKVRKVLSEMKVGKDRKKIISTLLSVI